MSKDYYKIGKALTKALRHTPKEFKIELDDEGWTKIEDLVNGMKRKGYDVDRDDILIAISKSDKKRHEISEDGEWIRCLYGHSFNNKIMKDKECPPEYLYHGTNQEALEMIKIEGLKPMNRQYIHYSIDLETAIKVGSRKTKIPLILKINSKEAYDDGVSFYKGNDETWLSDNLEFKYINIL